MRGRAELRSSLDGAPLLERYEGGPFANDDVVEELDAEDLAGVGHSPGEVEILGAWCGIAARMIVEQDDRGGVGEQGGREDGSRLDGGPAQRADVGQLMADGTVADVEKDRAHHPPIPRREELVEESRGDEGLATVLRHIVGRGLLANQGDAVAGNRLRLE